MLAYSAPNVSKNAMDSTSQQQTALPLPSAGKFFERAGVVKRFSRVVLCSFVSSIGRRLKFSYLTDILVADLADLLDIGGALGDVLERVAGEDELVLLGGGDSDLNTLGHGHAVDDLLANEVADLNLEEAGLLVLLKVDVDGKMGVDVAHLVLEALGDTDDHVVDDGADGAQSGDILAVAVVDLDRDGVLGGVAEADSQVAEVSDELACWSDPTLANAFLACIVSQPLQVVRADGFVPRSGIEGLVIRTSGALDGDGAGLDSNLDC